MIAPAFDPAKTKEIAWTGDLNTPEDVLLDHIRHNIKRGLPQMKFHPPNARTAVIVGGGPSINHPDVLADLRIASMDLPGQPGGKVVALNGAYNWCLSRKIRPSGMVMLDAREFNTRFLEEDVPGCTYFLAAQCHPKAFDLCKGRRVIMWHALSAGQAEVDLLDDYFFGRWNNRTTGTTVATRAISLLNMLGFRKMEVFGVDSCLMKPDGSVAADDDDVAHHAYEQAENDGGKVLSVWLRYHDGTAQRFLCHPWMAKQTDCFLKMTREMGSEFQLNVHGNGLIATMIRTGAQLEAPDDQDSAGRAIDHGSDRGSDQQAAGAGNA